ncbi:MAG: tRNA (adenosine(37)-N6)-threonylcarbamoyltransferase complex dimerization subunit type 1 TsaB [bacterium]|nr:tRNA (adenosine(37)-N6)-threonylcarbamoyltransferase complex dimerization subunit type 1 TsaB [bacterium]
MGILLIDSSSKKIEFGYALNDELAFMEELNPGDNADTLIYYLKQSFEKNKVDLSEIEYVSLSNGPGSFTGLRIGSAIAKGICYSNGSRFIEIQTLDIIAGKFKPVFEDTNKAPVNKQKIVSMIFSNSRTLEFYFAGYEMDLFAIKRISDYSTGFITEIMRGNDSVYLTNEKLTDNIDDRHLSMITDVSLGSNIPAHLDLALVKIKNGDFSDYKSSEPFYMKEFVPNK